MTAPTSAPRATPTPARPPVALEHVRVAVAHRRTCALLRDGQIRCWGLGVQPPPRNGGSHMAVPHAIAGVDHVVSLAAGYDRMCVVFSDGRARCGLESEPGVVSATGTPSPSLDTSVAAALADVRMVALGERQGAAVLTSGRLVRWGVAFGTELPTPGTDACPQSDSPSASRCWTHATDVSEIADARAVAAGRTHACAIRADATVACWGANDAGQLGDGTQTGSIAPRAVQGLGNVEQLALGQDFSCARRTDGTVYCWGAPSIVRRDGDSGAANTPVPLAGATDVVSISAHGGMLCWVRTGGDGRCVGPVALRVPPRSPGAGRPTIRTMIPDVRGPHRGYVDIAFSGAREVAVSIDHACLVTADDEVRCWGSNAAAEIGDPWATRRFAPVPVMAADGTPSLDDARRAVPQPPPSATPYAAPPPPPATTNYTFEALVIGNQGEASNPTPWSHSSLIRAALMRDAASFRACHTSAAGGFVQVRAVLDGEGSVVRDPSTGVGAAIVTRDVPTAEGACIVRAMAAVRWPFTRWPTTVEMPLTFQAGASP